MWTIDNIACRDLLELRTYRQPWQPGITGRRASTVVLMRNSNWCCRLVDGEPQEWQGNIEANCIGQKFAEWVTFEEKIGSRLL